MCDKLPKLSIVVQCEHMGANRRRGDSPGVERPFMISSLLILDNIWGKCPLAVIYSGGRVIWHASSKACSIVL
jgi:hypothetical protein